MSPASSDAPRQRPLPNYIQVAKPYIFQQTIDECLQATGVSQVREDNIRLAGVQWIDNVRRALRLPVRTFDTAVVYYHKFRLLHSDGEYSYADAAAAALFTACKIEDTLKKSRDILCAAYNLKLPPSEQLSPDDQLFEQHSRAIIGLERLMLEASSFDFRNRHPQQLLVKFAKYYGYTKESPVVRTAYNISLDLYRTFAPLKQITATMAFACLELSGRLHDEPNPNVWSNEDYRRMHTTREEVMETLLDLLELYTHYRTSTAIGAEFPVDTFLQVRIPLNEENLPRFTEYHELPNKDLPRSSHGDKANTVGKPAVNGRHGSTTRMVNGRPSSKNVSPKEIVSPMSAATGRGEREGGGAVPNANTNITANGTASRNPNPTTKVGERGREGTIRFMLDPDREYEEKKIISEYLDVG